MPGNPVAFGERLEDLGVEAVGIGATAVLNDRLTGPLAKQLVPQTGAGSVPAKLIDALATAVTGWASSLVVGILFGSHWGNLYKRGGVLLGVAKGAAALVPGYSPLGPLPVPSWFGTFGAAPGVKQLSAGAAPNGVATGALNPGTGSPLGSIPVSSTVGSLGF